MKRFTLYLSLSTLVFAFLAGALFSWPAFKRYKEKRGLRQAGAFLASGDLANASLGLRQVLQLNPRSIRACSAMAALAELAHSPAAIDWRQRVVDLDPSLPARLKLVACALRFERPPFTLASRILAEVKPSADDLPAFHVLSAELALKRNQPEEAAAHFHVAARLDPSNPLHRLNLAVLELPSTNLAIAENARGALTQLSTHTKLGPLALRWLVADHLRRDQIAGAQSLSCQLVAHPLAQLEDRLQHLTVLQRATQAGVTPAFPGFPEYLNEVQDHAVTNVVELYSVCEWMGSHGLADNALKWVDGCDPKMRDAEPVQLAVANLYLTKADWSALETFLQQKKWIDLEFLRLGLLARAAAGQGHSLAGETRWRGAVRTADERLGSLMLLLSLGTEWGQDAEAILWQIVERYPREKWALRDLERRYFAAGNTRGLNRVYTDQMSGGPALDDWTNRNNFACTSLLLGVNLPMAHATARELYQQHPADIIIASTYAYSRHLLGHPDEALAVFSRFQPKVLEQPSVAVYYAVVLTAAGYPNQARRFFDQAHKAKLLPEEQTLLAQASKGAASQGSEAEKKESK